MPANLVITESFPEIVQGPAGGDARTAASVRSMGSPLGSRDLWMMKRIQQIFGAHKQVEEVDASADTLKITAHGYVNGDVLRLLVLGGSLPTPLLENYAFHVVSATADTFKLSLTSGGSALDLTSTGSGTIYAFKVTTALHAIMHTAFTTLKGDTIPAGSLFATLAGYFMPTKGGTFVGATTYLGDTAYRVDRQDNDPAHADADIASLTLETKDFRRCPDVTGNRTIVLAEPTTRGLTSEIARFTYANAFAAVYRRASDNSIIGRLNAVGGIKFRSLDSDDGKGLTWHGVGYGGADQIT